METITRARQVVSGVYELNRNVLTADLKEFTVRIFCTQSGSSFQAFGAETEQERCWKSEIAVSMTRLLRAAERSLLLDSTVDTGRQSSDKYDGAKSLTASNTSRHSLNWMRFGPGSQIMQTVSQEVLHTVILPDTENVF